MLRRAADRLSRWPTIALLAGAFAVVALLHLTLLELPYYWDEGGYYVPAALDFFHRWTLIPQFTNAHPPLPNVVLGLLWHVTGLHILATRLCAAAFAGAALVAVFRLGERLLSPSAGLALAVLTGAYPIWYAQSTLAHADIFAAAFTLWGFAVYFANLGHGAHLGDQNATPLPHSPLRTPLLLATLFSLAALSKETAIVEPATLAAVELFFLLRARSAETRRPHTLRLAALSFPVLPLAAWFAYHRARTGFTFGNPEFLRYNATANLTVDHVYTALRYRFIHLFLQRDIWVALLFAAVCITLLPERRKGLLPHTRILATGAVLVFANWVAFSVLGGALLTRYLLPMYPLILLANLAVWRARTARWPLIAAATTALFVSAWWINPPIAFAPEDNLTYRDMIVVHQQAAHFIEQQYPHATVLTAWPMAADLFRPELGYVKTPFRVSPVENFTAPELIAAARRPGDFDTAVVFTTHYIAPSLEHYLQSHPNSVRGRDFERNRDLTPEEVARMLHGTVVWKTDLHGEAAAVLRFDRSYEATLRSGPTLPSQPHNPLPAR